MVLVLLGILASVAVLKFFDLQKEAERKTVLASAAEVQSRHEATFANKVLEGTPCTETRTFAATLANLADDGKKQFGEFSFQTSGNNSVSDSLALRYRRGNSGDWNSVVGLTLTLPVCSNKVRPGRDAFSAFYAFSTGSSVFHSVDDNYSFEIWVDNHNWVTMKITNSDVDISYTAYVGKNENADKIQNAWLIYREGNTDHRDDLMKEPKNETYAAIRDSQIEKNKNICPTLTPFSILKVVLLQNLALTIFLLQTSDFARADALRFTF